MPAARIITTQPQEIDSLKERLLRLGYSVEVVAPGTPQLTLPDIEIDATTVPVSMALDRAAGLAGSDADVLIAPGIVFEPPPVKAVEETPKVAAPSHPRKDRSTERVPVSRVLATALTEVWRDARTSSASARDGLAAILRQQREHLEARRTRVGEHLADWSQRRALRRALREQEQQLREQRRAEEREVRQRLDEIAADRENNLAVERVTETPSRAPADLLPKRQTETTRESELRPPQPAVARKMKPTRVIYSPRDRQFQHAVFLSSLVALALMLGFALAMGGGKPNPMPSAMAPPHVNVQQQVPFGPATATVIPANESPKPRVNRKLKPAPDHRKRLDRSSAGTAVEDEVVVYHYPSRRVSAKSDGVRRYSDTTVKTGIRRYSDTSEEAVVHRSSGSSQDLGVEDRGIKRISDQD